MKSLNLPLSVKPLNFTNSLEDMSLNRQLTINSSKELAEFDFIRLETDMARYSHYFYRYYGDDGKIMFQIMVYLSSKTQGEPNELFFGALDPDNPDIFTLPFDPLEYAKMYGRSATENLWRRHHSPSIEKLKGKVDEDEYNYFSSVIGNAIYRLQNESITITEKIGGDLISRNMRPLYGIESANVKHLKRGQKHVFYVRVNKAFITAMSKAYSVINTDYFVFLDQRKRKLGAAYCHLVNKASLIEYHIKHAGKRDFTWEYLIKDMKEILQVNIKSTKETTRNIKKKLAFLNEHTDLELDVTFFISEWGKSKGNLYYDKCRIDFKHLAHRFDENWQKVQDPIEDEIRYQAFLHLYISNVRGKFQKSYAGTELFTPDNAFKWLVHPRQDYDFRKSAFEDTYQAIHGKPLEGDREARFKAFSLKDIPALMSVESIVPYLLEPSGSDQKKLDK